MKKGMKNQMIKGVFALFMLTTTAGFASSSVLTILSFNDVYEISPDSLGRGGFAEIEALIQRERANATHHITTLNGDFLSPCTLSVFDKGAHRIDLFNQMGIDLVVLGNHEFDFGPDVVLERIASSRFPWLAANAIGLDGKPFTGDTQKVILDVDGIKVGFFGLITVDTPRLSSTENRVCFAPLVYTARNMVEELKEEGADVIVALTHLRMGEDRRLANEVPEIDVILGGHDHEVMTYYDDKAFVHKSGQNAYYLVRLDLHLDKDETSGKVTALPSWNMILNKGIIRDPVVGSMVDALQKTVENLACEPLGVFAQGCDSFSSNVRSEETMIGNYFADVLRSSLDTDLTFITGGLIRGNKVYSEGDMLTFKGLIDELPFGNLAVVLEMQGKNIIEALEHGLVHIKDKGGRFPQVSGLTFTCHPRAPVGKRISNVRVGNEKIIPDKFYKVATVDYLFNGGDGYEMFKGGNIIMSPLDKVGIIDLIANHIRESSLIEMSLDGRIEIECSYYEPLDALHQ